MRLERLRSALSRPFAAVFARRRRRALGGDVPDGSREARDDQGASFDEALRQAFRSAAPLTPAVSARPEPEPEPAPEAAPEAAADAEAARPRAAAFVPEPVERPSADPGPADEPAGPDTRVSAPAGPGDMLRIPDGVGIAADDFFGGLIRRAGRDS